MHSNGTNDSAGAFPRFACEQVIAPGLTSRHTALGPLALEIDKRLRAYLYKHASPCLWLVFLGGTGTGKSTLFNALCGRTLSRTGVERPKTRGPLAYAHAKNPLEAGFPFPELSPKRRPLGKTASAPESGDPEELLILEHRDEAFFHLVLVDTPDLDSLEEENRRVARALALLSDGVVFVTSQEKYADDVPSGFLRNILDEGKPVYFLLNKADPGFSSNDALEVFSGRGIHLSHERIWALPRFSNTHPQAVSRQAGFQGFCSRLLEDFPPSSSLMRRAEALDLESKGLKRRLDRLLEILHAEHQAVDAWFKRLEALFLEISEDLVQAQSDHFASRNRRHIQRQIRRLFSRYDLLSGPRKAVRRVILTPLRILGLNAQKKAPEQNKGLQEARSAENLAPIPAAVDRFGRRALEDLSPSDQEAPLYEALRKPGVTMSRDEVEARVRSEQDQMETWLRETFDTMARGLPTAKKWSIYSTSIVWGILVLSLEATLGGGFTVIDALLGSALAPFLTKGSAELFAYREIQKVVRDMAKRYRQGLISILEEQRDRYASALGSVSMPPEEQERIVTLSKRLAQRSQQTSTPAPPKRSP